MVTYDVKLVLLSYSSRISCFENCIVMQIQYESWQALSKKKKCHTRFETRRIFASYLMPRFYCWGLGTIKANINNIFWDKNEISIGLGPQLRNWHNKETQMQNSAKHQLPATRWVYIVL